MTMWIKEVMWKEATAPLLTLTACQAPQIYMVDGTKCQEMDALTVLCCCIELVMTH